MKLLYKIPLEEASHTNQRDVRRSQLAEAGVLGESAVVEQVSSGAADLTLEGQWRTGTWHAELFATELQELANSTIEATPLFRKNGTIAEAGYYEVESANVEPAHANAQDVYAWELGLKKKGTTRESYRQLAINRRQVDHDFGSDLTALIGVPAAAQKVQWYNPTDGSRSPASASQTRSAEFADVEMYDLDAGETAVGSDPTLIYEIDYGDERWPDCRVYDTLGEAEKYVENADGRVRVWESVFDPAHDPEGNVILDTGRLRVTLDEANGTLSAERWDATNTVWSSVSLSKPSTTDLYDVDLTEIGMVRVVAQLTFDVDGTLYALDAIAKRGGEDVLWHIPDNESGPIPTELQNWLSPIAATTIVDPQGTKTLASRTEVRR
ncbi:hypothetical protein [Halosolutus halophilus]|uniref:hypothetical protein n=1 Tax=Halosolutus halophilus TaxID=1552990 RepID=UPI002234F0E7|nr:hypothetical protein [Halosolutus halophilus]